MTSFSSLISILRESLGTNKIRVEFRMDASHIYSVPIKCFAINCSLFSPCVPKYFKLSLSDHDSLFVGNLSLFSAIPKIVRWLWVYEK